MRMDAHGVAVELPAGWEGEIYRRGGDALQGFGTGWTRPGEEDRSLSLGETSRSVTHLANFPLPPGRGDYGSGAVEVMRSGDVLVVLFEFEPSSRSQALFSHAGIPVVDAADFDPHQLQRTLLGQAGVQYFFHEAGRAFCLYVVLGDHQTSDGAADAVNALLAGIELEPA